MFEVDTSAYSFDLLVEWLRTPVLNPLPADVAHNHYLLMHPRTVFIKNLPLASTLFDIGTGNGGLVGFKDWLGFNRPDLRFVGASLAHGQHTHKYDEFFLGNLDKEKPIFNIPPQYALASQLIEHIGKPEELFNWINDLIPKGGKFYLDWPSAHTVDLPQRKLFLEAGFNVTTFNFFDDPTHLTAYPIADIVGRIEKSGFQVQVAGYLEMPFIGESLKHQGIAENNSYFLSMALWMKAKFVSYIIAEKL
jgi:hypothetical protein